MKKVALILGSTRQQRFGHTVAKWLMDEVNQQAQLLVEFFDLRDVALPFYDEPKPPMAIHRQFTNPIAQRWSNNMAASAGYIFVSPEYNHSYSAVLKNAIDYLWDEWQNKPYIIITYSPGAIGGARAGEHLRALLNYIGLQQCGELNITFAYQQFNENGQLINKELSDQAQKLLVALAEA